MGDIVVCIDPDMDMRDMTANKEYIISGMDVTIGDIMVKDDIGDDVWWDTGVFKLPLNNQQIVIEKNFSVTVAGGIFKVEANGLSEEKINKIIDILAK